MHHGNVLRKIGTIEVVIIDIEYGLPTTRGFDVANYLSEFCANYDAEDRWVLNSSEYPSEAFIDEILSSYVQNSLPDSKLDVDRIKNEIAAYLPIVQLFWGHWSVFQAFQVPEKSMDFYLEFAHQRYRRFMEIMSSN